MLHVASFATGTRAEFYLSRIIEDRRVSLHRFASIDELLVLAQRFILDLIYIGTGDIPADEFMKTLDMIHRIKNHTYLAIIPTVIYHPQPADTMLTAAYENGAEEVFTEKLPAHIARVKTMMLIQRAIRDLSINPSSRLPGPASIEREIERQIEMGQQFAVCYADLDNFKAFNDYYGYYFGDRIIQLTARIIKDIVFDLCREGFVGHIGGDDFIFVIPADMVSTICEHIIHTFDTLIPYRYHPDDRERGIITTANRSGTVEEYEIMTISIAVVVNKGRMFTHVGEMSHMLADLKTYTKSLEGSNYVLERRRKY
jgi:diguanylate cyclase (GGDEF)-like protein